MSVKLNNLNDLTDQFDMFVFDLCGVVHNGISLHQDTVRFIKSLKSLGKQVVFLSNSPNSAQKSYNYLVEKGFDSIDEDKIFTSGDFFIQNCKTNPIFKNKNFYFFGIERNKDFLEKSNISLVESTSNADYIICSFFSSDHQEAERFASETKNLFSKAALPLICSNPDIRAPHGNELRYTPGYFAKIYEEIGGEVIYFGKPHQAIYENLFFRVDPKNTISKERILMIGDSMHTDVRGAKSVDIKSLLIGKGYHRETDFRNNSDLEELFLQYGFQPDYYIEGIK